MSGPDDPVTPPVHYRQGDVLILAVAQVPDDCRPIAAESGRFVLAHGERTGHSHAVAVADVEFVVQPSDRRRFLRILRDDGVDLRHEEHAPIRLPRGTYEVRRQREYRPDSRSSSWVRD